MSKLQDIRDEIFDATGNHASADALVIWCGLQAVAGALHALGNADAATPMGALEMLGLTMKESAVAQTAALERIASAIESRA